MYDSWDMVCDEQTDNWTDKKWHIEVCAPPNSIFFLMANNHWSLALSLCNLTVPIFLMYIKMWNVNYCYQDINILSYSVVKSITPPLLILKRDSNTDDFLWILHFFKEHLFWRTAANGCFWFFKTATGHRSAAAPVLNLLSNLHWIFLSTVSPPLYFAIYHF